MKRIITSAVIILLTIGSAQSQTTTPEKAKSQKKEHRKDGFKDLNLSPDQQAKMKTLREDFKKQSSDLKSNQLLSDADKKARRQELHKQHQAQVHAILTPTQKDQLAQKKAGWKANSKEVNKDARRGDRTTRGSKARGGDRSAAFEKLELSSEQQAKMKGIRTDFRSKMESLRSDNTLTKEQKHTRLQELKKQQKDQVKSVLTKEQIQKMQSQRKDRGAKNTK